MKKALILILAMGFTGVIFAQIPGFTLGPKIGFNTTKLSTDASAVTSELKSKFQFGVFVRLGDKVFVQPEANYVTKGGVLKGVNTAGDAIKQEVTLKTLTVPILLGVKIINLKVLSVHLVGGPVASFALNKKLSITNPDDVWPIQSSKDFKTASWAIQAGAGVDVLSFTFDLRYEAGLGNMYNGSVKDISFKNNLFNASLGIKLF
jgi:hypothetical protein